MERLSYPDLATDHPHESKFVALYGDTDSVLALRAKRSMNGIGPPILKQIVVEPRIAGETGQHQRLSQLLQRQMHAQRPRYVALASIEQPRIVN